MDKKLGAFLLRVGLAFVFFYAGVASFLDPASWLGFFPAFLRTLLPVPVLTAGFSILEIGLALWLLSGRLVVLAALASALALSGIVAFNLGALDIVFRDVGLFFAALALLAIHL